MEVIGLKEVSKSKMPYVSAVVYRSGEFPGGLPLLQAGLERYLANTYVRIHKSRDKEIDISEEIHSVWIEAGELCVRIRTRPSGSSISPYLAFAGLLETDAELLRSMPIYKHDFTLEEKVAVV
jgi:hypothetical protein